MGTAASVFSTRQNFLRIRTALRGRDVLAEATKGANQSGFSRMEGCTRRALEAAGAAAGRRSMRQPPGDRQGILPRLLIPPVRQSRLPKFSGRRSHPPLLPSERARPAGGLRLFLPSFRGGSDDDQLSCVGCLPRNTEVSFILRKAHLRRTQTGPGRTV